MTALLRGNEYSISDLPAGPVKSFETNSLRSNNPVEDSHSEAMVSNGEGYLFGIYDGHGGAACGQVTAKRLQNYVAAGLLNQADLEAHLKCVAEAVRSNNSSPTPELLPCIQTLNEQFELVQDLRDIYMKSYHEYLSKLAQNFHHSSDPPNENIERVLTEAFNSLDADMSREALPCPVNGVNMKTLTVAMSGCVAVVAHIDGPHLHVAYSGHVYIHILNILRCGKMFERVGKCLTARGKIFVRVGKYFSAWENICQHGKLFVNVGKCMYACPR